jgi:hypothetical protein
VLLCTGFFLRRCPPHRRLQHHVTNNASSFLKGGLCNQMASDCDAIKHPT